MVVGKRRGAPIGAAFFALLCVLGVCAGGEHFTGERTAVPTSLPHWFPLYRLFLCMCRDVGAKGQRGVGWRGRGRRQGRGAGGLNLTVGSDALDGSPSSRREGSIGGTAAGV
eukprot:COSAG02_NODE_6371_length_3618_cov_14.231369_5_plen_112_part_00